MAQTLFKGYMRRDFELAGHTGSVIFPEKNAVCKPWIWRAEFLGDFDKADMELVRLGWHLVYYKISDMYGCPEAVRLMNQFHEFLIAEYGLKNKTVLFGFSRGGLYAVNYAVAYPEKVQSLYLDAPVINMQYWPRQDSSEKNWNECMKWYGFDEKGSEEYSKSQLDRASVLAAHKIPILIVAGDADSVIPFEKHAKPFIDKYLETHCDIKTILKKGCAHHPHSLEDVEPIIEFVTKNNTEVDYG